MSESKVLKKREEIENKYKWKVDKIFSTDEEWEKTFEELKKEAPSLKDFEGKLNDEENILGYLNKYVDLGIKAETVYVYAHLKCDEDTSNPKYQSMMNKVDSYMAEFASYTAYFVPEILSLEDDFIRNTINTNEKLKMYSFMFEDILKEKPHILSKEQEELLAQVSDCLDAPDSIHNMLTNADMKFGDILDEDGKKVELTEGNYSGFIKSKDRKVREEAFKTLFKSYKDLENTLRKKFSCKENYTLVMGDVLEVDLRKYINQGTKVVANIPYYITSPIINKIIENKDLIDEAYIMVQKEVGERICAKSGKERGILTLAVEYYGEAEYLFTIPREFFNPIPNVDSAFISIKFYKDDRYKNKISEDLFFKYVKAAFSNKRKNIVNNLVTLGYSKDKIKEILNQIEVSENERAENISIDKFIELINIFEGR